MPAKPAQISRTSRSKKTPTKRSAANLPKPPSLWASVGPSFILLGLALGSGELILWPYLAATWGLGLLWGGLLGISLQYVLNTEIMRYSLARGESVFVGFRKLSPLWPVWFILSTFIPWSIPGFSSASSQIISGYISADWNQAIAIGLLLLTGIILTAGKTLYKTMEIFQRTIILFGLPILILMTFYLARSSDWTELLFGLVGRGDGYWFFPSGIGIAAFLGAFAYSGAGGNLNLAQSYYIKEKGFGMGAAMEKISSLLRGGSRAISVEGQLFDDTPSNRKRWNAWWRLVTLEHLIVFWGLGFASIAILSVLARRLSYGLPHGEDLAFLYHEAAMITEAIGPFFGTLFLLLAALMLFSTQVGVLESSSRIISENTLLFGFKKGKKFNLSLAFYIALWGQIALGIIILLSGFQQPRLLLTLGAILNGAAMMVAFPLLLWLNTRQLPEFIRPRRLRRGLLLAGFLFFLLFFGILVADLL